MNDLAGNAEEREREKGKMQMVKYEPLFVGFRFGEIVQNVKVNCKLPVNAQL